jgi:ABC-type uncharacterized transport system substrate-binding protein
MPERTHATATPRPAVSIGSRRTVPIAARRRRRIETLAEAPPSRARGNAHPERYGNNIHLDYRFGGGDLAKITYSAGELVGLGPDLIYAQGLPAKRAVHQKTHKIPIVFAQVADPVGFGLVQSVAHPAGNVTGFVVWDLSIGGKWMEFLREIAPALSRVGIIYNPDLMHHP